MLRSGIALTSVCCPMKPALVCVRALLLCGLCLSSLSGCRPLREDSSGFRLWLADLPNPLDRDRPRPLARLTQLAQAGQAKTVYVKGEVLRLSPLLDGMAYEIEDETGRMWIQTQRRDVTLGETVHIQGKLRRRVASIEGEDFGEAYVEELRQVNEG